MAAGIVERMPVEARDEERAQVAEVEQFLDRVHPAKLLAADGQMVELPAALHEVLRRATRVLARQDAVAIAPVHRLLTTNEAADLLAISRPSLIRVLVRGDLPYTMVESYQRVGLADLVRYKQSCDAQRRDALDRLEQITDALGLYDQE